MSSSLNKEFLDLVATGDSVLVSNFINNYQQNNNSKFLDDLKIDGVMVALESASRNGFLSIFKIIFELLNDELLTSNQKGLSECLYLACEMNYIDIVKLIIPHVDDVWPKNFGGRYGYFVDPIMAPLEDGYFGIVWWYFEKFSVNNACYCIPSRGQYDCEKYPLYVAVENGKYDIAQYLLAKGADADEFNDQSRVTALYRAFELEDNDMIELLLRFEANYQNVTHYKMEAGLQERFNSVISTVLDRIQKKKMQISLKLFANTKYADVFFDFLNQIDY